MRVRGCGLGKQHTERAPAVAARPRLHLLTSRLLLRPPSPFQPSQHLWLVTLRLLNLKPVARVVVARVVVALLVAVVAAVVYVANVVL